MDPSEVPHILSVEDNPETRLLLKHQLQEVYEVTFAASADEALELIEAMDFDLFLLDINLGEETSGTHLLHAVRSREEAPHTPAIALTAYAMPGDEEDLLGEGFDEYVGKPFTRAELTETIDKVLFGAVEATETERSPDH